MLKAKALLPCIALALSLVLSGCASRTIIQPGDTGSLEGLKELRGQAPNPKADQTQFRMLSIKETALSIGAQSGLAWRAKQINSVVDVQTKQLEQIFNFEALMLENHVLPPVLAESKGSLKLDGNNAIRLADRTYKIVTQARFVTTAPNWRNYLSMHYEKPERPHPSLLPKNAKEIAYWHEYVTIGWQKGIQQANTIYADNLARLKRDYQGMLIYRKLLTQNIVSKPYVAKTELGITGSGSDMSINDRVLRITALPQLHANSKDWKSVINSDAQ